MYRQPVTGLSSPWRNNSWRSNPGRTDPDLADPWRANVARSVRLWRAFRKEQSDPDAFYGTLAKDSAQQVATWHPLHGARMLDVGGGPGYFQEAFERLGATYFAVDADAGEMRLHGRTPSTRTVQARGDGLPFADESFDLTYSSNVLEHVEHPWDMADDMLRVTKVGGTLVISYTLWWGPWGGHETAPWHYLGGERAAGRYAKRTGQEPKNRFGESLFAVTAAEGIRWAKSTTQARVLAAIPRYLPHWAAPITRVRGVRELATWNLMLVLRRGAAA